MDEFEYPVEKREFDEFRLPNGLRCIFVHDPKMENVAIQLNIQAGFSVDPVGLSGLSDVSKSSLGHGSARYPGLGNFETFLRENEIKFAERIFFDANQINAEVPEFAMEEYLDRLSDLLENSEISKETLEYTELRKGRIYYASLNVDKYREVQVLAYLLFGKLYQNSLLFSRKDLVARVREFIDFYVRPSNMTVYLIGSISIVVMRRLVIKYFSHLDHKHSISIPKALSGPPGTKIGFADRIRKPDQALIAWTHSRSHDKRLSVSFRLPLESDQSCPLYLAYLINRSQPGSLNYRLKSLGLVKDTFAEHVAYSTNFETLTIHFTLTSCGSWNVPTVISYLLGYVQKLRQLHPNYPLFEQAHEYFKCINAQNDPMADLDHYSNEILMGTKIHELHNANIPTRSDANHIRHLLAALHLGNCFIVAMSDEYVNTPVHTESDYYLQFSVENLNIEPRFDGIMKPQSDILVISSQRLNVPTLDLKMICTSPVVYQQSISSEFYTFVNIGVQSKAFRNFSASSQRLYAALLRYKLFLVAMRNICSVDVEVVDSSLHILVKSLPGTLLSLTSVLVEYMTTPLTYEFQEKLIELKEEEEKLMCSWLSGATDVEFEPAFKRIYNCDVNISKQVSELRAVNNLCDLPRSVNGELLLLLGGNANAKLSSAVTLEMISLHKSDIEGQRYEPEDNPGGHTASTRDRSQDYERELISEFSPADLRETFSRNQGIDSSVIKVFNLGPFSHSIWAASLMVTDLANNILSETMRRCDLFGSRLSIKNIQKNGWIGLIVRCDGISPTKELEDMVLKFVFKDLAELLSCVDENAIYESQLAVLKKFTAVRQSSEAEMKRLWDSIWPNPHDVRFFETMQEVLWDSSLPVVREFYYSYLSRGKSFGTETVILKSCEESTYLSMVAKLELEMMDTYVPAAEREQRSPFWADQRPEEYISPRQKLDYWSNLLSEFSQIEYRSF